MAGPVSVVVTERQPPLNGELRVGEDVAVGDLEGVVERLGAGPARRRDLGDVGAERSGRGQQDFDPVGPSAEVDRLIEDDLLAEGRAGGRRAERGRRRECHRRRERHARGSEHEREGHDRRRDPRPESDTTGPADPRLSRRRHQFDHARPAKRMKPSPASVAPRSPGRASAQPDPFSIGITGASCWTTPSALA